MPSWSLDEAADDATLKTATESVRATDELAAMAARALRASVAKNAELEQRNEELQRRIEALDAQVAMQPAAAAPRTAGGGGAYMDSDGSVHVTIQGLEFVSGQNPTPTLPDGDQLKQLHAAVGRMLKQTVDSLVALGDSNEGHAAKAAFLKALHGLLQAAQEWIQQKGRAPLPSEVEPAANGGDGAADALPESCKEVQDAHKEILEEIKAGKVKAAGDAAFNETWPARMEQLEQKKRRLAEHGKLLAEGERKKPKAGGASDGAIAPSTPLAPKAKDAKLAEAKARHAEGVAALEDPKVTGVRLVKLGVDITRLFREADTAEAEPAVAAKLQAAAAKLNLLQEAETKLEGVSVRLPLLEDAIRAGLSEAWAAPRRHLLQRVPELCAALESALESALASVGQKAAAATDGWAAAAQALNAALGQFTAGVAEDEASLGIAKAHAAAAVGAKLLEALDKRIAALERCRKGAEDGETDYDGDVMEAKWTAFELPAGGAELIAELQALAELVRKLPKAAE